MSNEEQKRIMGNYGNGTDSGRGATPAPGFADVMQMFLEENRRREELERCRRDEENRRREDELRRQEAERERKKESIRIQRENEREANRAQQERLIQTLTENRRRTPEPSTTTSSYDLPRMREEDELEEFIPVFETSLRVYNVPANLWKQKLLTHLPLKSLVKIDEVLQVEG